MKLSKKILNIPLLSTGMMLMLLIALLYVFEPAFIRHLDYSLYDVFLKKVHKSKTTGLPVIVDLDEESLKRFGQWPWPRYRVALLLEKIKQAGAIGIGLDILFAEPDRTSPRTLQNDLKRDLKVDVQFAGLPAALMDNDQLLSGILSNGPYTLGFFFDFEKPENLIEQEHLHPLSPTILKTPGTGKPDSYLLVAPAVVPPLTQLVRSVRSTGFINALPDDDGILRRTPLVISWQDKIYPSLGLATLRTALGNPPAALKMTPGGIKSLRIGRSIVPLDKNGRILIHFRGANKAFPYISAARVLEDKLKPEALKGKIVLVGTSAAGLKDMRASPLNPILPGVEIQATVIDNILQEDFISRPDWAPGLEFFLIIFSGIVTTFLIARTTAKWTMPITLISGLIMWQMGIVFLDKWRIFISPLFPLITLAGNFALLTLLKFWISEKEKRFFKGAFSKYVSKAVVDQIAESPETLSLEGEEKNVSILFSDIRSFTTLSEKLTPTQVTQLLHDYLTPMTRIITTNMGTLDKFIGDAVMAFWNAPLDVVDHEKMAVKSGVEMVLALEELNRHFTQKFGFELNIGIGIHSGIVRVGNMGSEDLFDYTILGDNVNLSSRLEGLTKYYGVKILFSENLKSSCPEGYQPQELDFVRVKGKTEPIRIYGLFTGRHSSDPEKEMTFYKEALSKYHDRQFSEALKMFSALQKNFVDRELYALYKKRCETFLDDPPPEDWDGVYSHLSK